MKVFLAGASGFVGGHVAEALRLRGNAVTAWSRRDGPLPQSLTGYDAVYNMVGQLGKDGLADRVYYDAHAAFPLELLQRGGSQTLFVQMSSAYCSQPEGTVHRGYVESKLLGERIVKALAPRYCLVRPGLLYGPRDRHHLPLFKAVVRLGKWCPIPGAAVCCPTYVLDLARELADPGKLSGVRTISGQPVTIPVLMGLIARAAGQQPPQWRMPSIVKRDFFTRSHVFASDPPYNETPLLTGLTATVAEYRKEGAI